MTLFTAEQVKDTEWREARNFDRGEMKKICLKKRTDPEAAAGEYESDWQLRKFFTRYGASDMLNPRKTTAAAEGVVVDFSDPASVYAPLVKLLYGGLIFLFYIYRLQNSVILGLEKQKLPVKSPFIFILRAISVKKHKKKGNSAHKNAVYKVKDGDWIEYTYLLPLIYCHRILTKKVILYAHKMTFYSKKLQHYIGMT